MQLLIDTGASVSLMTAEDFKRHFSMPCPKLSSTCGIKRTRCARRVGSARDSSVSNESGPGGCSHFSTVGVTRAPIRVGGSSSTACARASETTQSKAMDGRDRGVSRSARETAGTNQEGTSGNLAAGGDRRIAGPDKARGKRRVAGACLRSLPPADTSLFYLMGPPWRAVCQRRSAPPSCSAPLAPRISRFVRCLRFRPFDPRSGFASPEPCACGRCAPKSDASWGRLCLRGGVFPGSSIGAIERDPCRKIYGWLIGKYMRGHAAAMRGLSSITAASAGNAIRTSAGVVPPRIGDRASSDEPCAFDSRYRRG